MIHRVVVGKYICRRLETFGGWDKDTIKLLKDIVRLGARRWARNDAIGIKHFFKCLNVIAGIDQVQYERIYCLMDHHGKLGVMRVVTSH